MDVIELLDFLAVYSLPTLITAFISAVIKLVCDKLLSKKLDKNLLSVLPFIISFLLSLAYDCAFVKGGFCVDEDAFTAGLLSGSLASLFTAVFYRIKDGRFSDMSDGVKLVLEGVLKNYVKKDLLLQAVIKVKDLIETSSANLEHDHDTLINLIADTIKECSEDGITFEEIKAVSELAVKAVLQLKNR